MFLVPQRDALRERLEGEAGAVAELRGLLDIARERHGADAALLREAREAAQPVADS